jgi:GTP-binding protein
MNSESNKIAAINTQESIIHSAKTFAYMDDIADDDEGWGDEDIPEDEDIEYLDEEEIEDLEDFEYEE